MTADLAFLEEFYRQKNELVGEVDGQLRCPSCGEQFVPYDLDAGGDADAEGIAGDPLAASLT